MTPLASFRREPALVIAVATSMALAATVALAPTAPWRIPIALLGGIWGPGYALLGAAYPRGELSALERHALATCAGLCLVPLVALLASETVGLRPPALACLGLASTVVLAIAAAMRAPQRARSTEAEPLVRTRLPSTRATLAVCLAALAVAAGVEAASILTHRPEPASLSLRAPSGELDLTLGPGENATIVVVLDAGDGEVDAPLIVRWDEVVLEDAEVALATQASREVEVALPIGAPGPHLLIAAWGDLEVHARITVEAE